MRYGGRQSAEAEATNQVPAGSTLGVPEDFHAQLNGLIVDYDGALQAWQSSRTTRRTARLNLDLVFASSTRLFDVVIPNRFRDDRATLAVWEQHRRVDNRGWGNGGKCEVESSKCEVEVRWRRYVAPQNRQPATRTIPVR